MKSPFAKDAKRLWMRLMLDLSQPVSFGFILQTIGLIFVCIAIGVYFVKKNIPKEES